jgi:hypothetical protein
VILNGLALPSRYLHRTAGWSYRGRGNRHGAVGADPSAAGLPRWSQRRSRTLRGAPRPGTRRAGSGHGFTGAGPARRPGPPAASRAAERGPSYRCPGGHVTRAAARLDEYVAAFITARLARPDAAELLGPRGSDLDPVEPPPVRGEVVMLKDSADA